MRLPKVTIGVRSRPRGGTCRMHTDSDSAQPPRLARTGSTLFEEKLLVIEARASLVMERRKRGSG
ncbi:hypothetical protein GTS_55730 [Gandjariella thermophila]|uniref:Uncharacterized protein n=1 Tax=Gandjariella thermophila TaxID=1931992 RepID=A0A4D4JG03_9PSEU|nr:hypothetical protein GTS_55730 [Gandjariella thermophila]